MGRRRSAPGRVPTYNITDDFNIALQIQPNILVCLSLWTWAQCQYHGHKRNLTKTRLLRRRYCHNPWRDRSGTRLCTPSGRQTRPGVGGYTNGYSRGSPFSREVFSVITLTYTRRARMLVCRLSLRCWMLVEISLLLSLLSFSAALVHWGL